MTSIRTRKNRSGKRVWLVDYRDAAGARRFKQYSDKDSAEQFFADVVKKEHQARSAVHASTVTIDEYSKRWLAAIAPTIAPRTHRSYTQIVRLYIEPTIGEMRLVDLTEAHVGALLTAFAQSGKAPDTVRLIRAVLSAMCSDAADPDSGEAILTRNPVLQAGGRRVRRGERRRQKALRVKRHRTFTRAELEAFLEHTASRGLTYETLFVFMADQGPRPDEAIKLRWEGVDLRAKTARIWAQKTYTERVVELTDRTVRRLRTLRKTLKEGALASGAPISEFVFRNAAGREVDQSRLNRLVGKICMDAGIVGKHSIYDFRHTFATLSLEAGKPATWVASQMGDSVKTVLTHYAHAQRARRGGDLAKQRA